EMAPYHVTVNAICPGPTQTEANRRALARRASMLGVSLEETLAQVQRSIPLGRWGEPEDVATAVAFLTSDGAAFITAETLTVSGGLPGGSKVLPTAHVAGLRGLAGH